MNSTGSRDAMQKDNIALRLYRLRYSELNEFSQEFVDDVVQLIRSDTNQRLKSFKEAVEGAMPEQKEATYPDPSDTIVRNNAIDDCVHAISEIYSEFTKEGGK